VSKGINPHVMFAAEFERIANAIEANPDWMADETIDGATVIQALREAATARRNRANKR